MPGRGPRRRCGVPSGGSSRATRSCSWRGTSRARWAGPVAYRQAAWLWHAARSGRLREHTGGLADALPLLPGALRARRELRAVARLRVEDVVPDAPWRGPRAGGHPGNPR